MEAAERDPEPASWMTWDQTSQDFQQQLRHVFDICDVDRDGLVTAGDFRRLTQPHVDSEEQMEELMLEVDPDNQGVITFDKFKNGIQSFIASTQRQSGNSSRCSDSFSLSSSDDPEVGSSSQGEFDSALSVEDIHHWDRGMRPYHSNGYEVVVTTSSPVRGDSTSTIECDQLEADCSQQSESETSSSFSLIIRPSNVSPTLTAKSLKRKQNFLQVSQASSSCSTPEIRREEDVEHLSDKVEELSSRLENLVTDLDSSQTQTSRLKKENLSLREQLEIYEERLSEAEQVKVVEEKRRQEELRAALAKVKRENESKIDELTLQLTQSRQQTNSVQNSLNDLKQQFETTQLEKKEKEEVMDELEMKVAELQTELQRQREQLRVERERWHDEMEAAHQEVVDRGMMLEELKREVEESKTDHRRSDISKSDLQDGVILQLKEKIQTLTQENEQLSAHLVQQGKQLVAPVPSLAQELENAPKDELMKALKDTEEVNTRLQSYIESLLITIINKNPELLEIK